MERLLIEGGHRLEGTVPIVGAKNAALPQLAASLLGSEPLTLTNVPDVADVRSMMTLLEHYGATVLARSGAVTVEAAGVVNREAPYDIVRRMRATILVLGPLLARFGEARVSLPGGCAIGARPVDLHIKALTALGATDRRSTAAPSMPARADGLRGGRILFGSPSVGGDRDRPDGGRAGPGRDRDHERGPRAGGRRPLRLPGRDGGRDRGRGHPPHPRPGRAAPAQGPARDPARPHRGRHLRGGGRDHRRPVGAHGRAAGASGGRRRGAGGRRGAHLAAPTAASWCRGPAG